MKTTDRVGCPTIDRSFGGHQMPDQGPATILHKERIELQQGGGSEGEKVKSALQDQIIAFALDQKGKGYDYRGIFGFLARKDLDRADKWFCSELVAACFLSAQIPLVRDYPHKIAPSDLKRSPLVNMYALTYTRTGSTVPPPGSGQIRIALYLGISVVSKFIEFRTWSDYSHASLVLPDDSVVESLPGKGVRHHPHLSELHTDRTCVEIYTINLDAALLCRSANPQGTVPAVNPVNPVNTTNER